MKLTAILTMITSLFSCNAKKPDMIDGPGMSYNPNDYQTEYANAVDFDSAVGDPCFAVVYLKQNDDFDKDSFIGSIFPTLQTTSFEDIQLFEFGGQHLYFVIPRYNDYVNIINTNTNEKNIVNNGMPFFVRCSDNIEIGVDSNGGRKYLLKIGEDGKLVASDNVLDMTEYDSFSESVSDTGSETMLFDYFCSNADDGHYELVLIKKNNEEYILDVYDKETCDAAEIKTSFTANHIAAAECLKVADEYTFEGWDTRPDALPEDGIKVVCKYISGSGEAVRVSNEKIPPDGREGLENIRKILESYIKAENRIG